MLFSVLRIMLLLMVPDQHVTNDHLFSSRNTETIQKCCLIEFVEKLLVIPTSKVLWLLIFLIYKKQCIFTIHTPLYNNSKLKEGQHSTQHWQWKQPNCQAEDIVGVFLKHNYQKLTNWKFVVGTQHEKSRMEENTNKMTAGWKVKGRQRILFVSTSSNGGPSKLQRV